MSKGTEERKMKRTSIEIIKINENKADALAHECAKTCNIVIYIDKYLSKVYLTFRSKASAIYYAKRIYNDSAVLNVKIDGKYLFTTKCILNYYVVFHYAYVTQEVEPLSGIRHFIIDSDYLPIIFYRKNLIKML